MEIQTERLVIPKELINDATLILLATHNYFYSHYSSTIKHVDANTMRKLTEASYINMPHITMTKWGRYGPSPTAECYVSDILHAEAYNVAKQYIKELGIIKILVTYMNSYYNDDMMIPFLENEIMAMYKCGYNKSHARDATHAALLYYTNVLYVSWGSVLQLCDTFAPLNGSDFEFILKNKFHIDSKTVKLLPRDDVTSRLSMDAIVDDYNSNIHVYLLNYEERVKEVKEYAAKSNVKQTAAKYLNDSGVKYPSLFSCVTDKIDNIGLAARKLATLMLSDEFSIDKFILSKCQSRAETPVKKHNKKLIKMIESKIKELKCHR